MQLTRIVLWLYVFLAAQMLRGMHDADDESTSVVVRYAHERSSIQEEEVQWE
jgi:hypothetical protein